MNKPAAIVKYYDAGGNTGLAWHAVEHQDCPVRPKEGELLYFGNDLVDNSGILLEALEEIANIVNDPVFNASPALRSCVCAEIRFAKKSFERNKE